MSHDVFISYSTKDKTVADAVCATLEKHKIRCWIAPRDITPGKEWGASIIDAIGASRVMILIFSASANDSLQIPREVERAVNREVILVPLRIENVAPTKALEYFLGSVHWLDALTPPLEKHLDKLVRAVEGVLGSIVDKQATQAAQAPARQPTKEAVASRSGAAVTAVQTRARKWVWQFVAIGALGVLVVVFAVIYSSRARSVDTHGISSPPTSASPSSDATPSPDAVANSDATTRAKQHYQNAVAAIAKNDWRSATGELVQAENLAPQNALVHYDVALVYSHTGQVKSALAELDKAVELGLPKAQEQSAKDLKKRLKARLRAP
jgi:Flp pilus assembly protein TadD